MQRKIFKFIKSSLENKNFPKNVAAIKEFRYKPKKLAKVFFKRKNPEKHEIGKWIFGMVKIFIGRHLNAPENFRSGAALRKILPQSLKEGKKLSNVWMKAASEMPTMSRGYRGRTVREVATDSKAVKPKRELPPPPRCRLCCPLPPQEFAPPEVNVFLERCQPPNVRFPSLQVEFLPRPVRTAASVRMMAQKGGPSSYGTSKPSGKRPKKPAPNLMPNSPKEVLPKMKALLFQPATLALNYDAVNAPTKIFKDEILVQVTYSGVCGTDLNITEGKVSCGNSPVILGHEISGKVYAAGRDVQHVQVGDRIAVNAYTACCVCRHCSRGQFSACLNEGLHNSIGLSKNGGWAEYVVVKKSQAYKIPQEVGLDQAALIQPLSCVLSAMAKLNLSHEMDIIIQGLGLSGCLWASVLHIRGHRKVYVSDKSEAKRRQFEALNLNYPFVSPESIGQQGADVIIECTGSPSVMETSFNILNQNGQMCFFGTANPISDIRCLPYEIIQKEITLIGNAGNAFRFSEAVDLAATMGHRYLDFEKLGVKTFDLEDFQGAFQMKKSGQLNKIIFKFES